MNDKWLKYLVKSRQVVEIVIYEETNEFIVEIASQNLG